MSKMGKHNFSSSTIGNILLLVFILEYFFIYVKKLLKFSHLSFHTDFYFQFFFVQPKTRPGWKL